MHSTLNESVPGCDTLTMKEAREIHYASVSVLEECGVRIDSEECLDMLGELGAEIDRATGVAKIPENLVVEAVQRAPKGFRLCAGNPRFDVRLGEGKTHFIPGGTPPFLLDASGLRRLSAKADVALTAKLVDSLENAAFHQPPSTAGDVPQDDRYIHEYEACFANTEKHLMHGASSRRDARAFIDMAAEIAGGYEELRRKPVCSLIICPVSPLSYPQTGRERYLDAMLEFTRLSLPVCTFSMPLAGVTSPITLAGTLVVQNAENLAGLVITESSNPGSPFIYGAGPGVGDLRRTCKAMFGGPEASLLCSASVDIVRKCYGIPILVGSFLTEAGRPDVQAGFEKALTAYPSLMAGADIIFNMGMLEGENLFSYTQLLIDDEIAGYMQRMKRGVDVDEEALGLAEIGDVRQSLVTGKSYLRQASTLKRVRSEIRWPELASIYEEKDILEKAREKLVELLAKG